MYLLRHYAIAALLLLSLTHGNTSLAGDFLQVPQEQILFKDAAHPYNPDVALHSSLWPTLFGVAIGSILPGITPFSTSSDNTIAGLVIAGAAISVAPSIGHLYSRNLRHGFASMGGRAALYSTAVFSLYGFGALSQSNNQDGANALFATSIMAGAGLVCLTVYDIVTAKRSARTANREHGEKQTAISGSPTFFSTQSKTPGFGLAIQGTF